MTRDYTKLRPVRYYILQGYGSLSFISKENSIHTSRSAAKYNEMITKNFEKILPVDYEKKYVVFKCHCGNFTREEEEINGISIL